MKQKVQIFFTNGTTLDIPDAVDFRIDGTFTSLLISDSKGDKIIVNCAAMRYLTLVDPKVTH